QTLRGGGGPPPGRFDYARRPPRADDRPGVPRPRRFPPSPEGRPMTADAPRPTVEPVAYPSDHRGLVVEPLAVHEFAAQGNAHLASTAPGRVRGNHCHERGTEVALVLGPALVRYRDGEAGPVRDLTLAPGEAVRFTFPPRVAHAMKNTGDAPMIILSFNTE